MNQWMIPPGTKGNLGVLLYAGGIYPACVAKTPQTAILKHKGKLKRSNLGAFLEKPY